MLCEVTTVLDPPGKSRKCHMSQSSLSRGLLSMLSSTFSVLFSIVESADSGTHRRKFSRNNF